MKNTYLFFVCLLAIAFSCSPKYGAHFQPSADGAYSARSDKAVEKEKNAAPVTEAKTADLIAAHSAAIAKNESTNPAELLVQRSEKGLKNIKVPLVQQEDQLLSNIKERIASMSAKEKRALKHQIKAAVRAYKAKHNAAEEEAPQATDTNLLLLIIISILIPPLGMFLYEGDITNRFWISLLLTLLFYVPGLVYTLVVILGGK